MMKMLKFKEFTRLLEDTLPVNIGKQTIGHVDSDDSDTIGKLSRIAGGSSIKKEIIDFLVGINYPASQAEILFDILLYSKDLNKIKEYLLNRNLDIKDLIGKLSDANKINQNIGLSGKPSSDFFSFSWRTSPPMGPGEVYLSTIIKDGRRPSGKDKGDVIVGNLEIEVKGSGARLVGQHGYGDGKQMRNAFKNAIKNIADNLKVNHEIIEGDDKYWNITKEKGRGFEENLIQISKLNKGFDKKELLMISEEIIKAWTTYLINIDVKKYAGAFSGCVDRNGRLDVPAYNKILLSIFFEYYYTIEKFQYFCITDNSGKFLIINPVDFDKFYENGTIKIKTPPSFSNLAGTQGASFAISL